MRNGNSFFVLGRDVTHYTFENKHDVIGASDKLTIMNYAL